MQLRSSLSASVLLACAAQVAADGYVASDCPLLGPDMPVPTALAADAGIQQVIQGFPDALSKGTYGNISLGSVSFSASVFSAADRATLYTLYNSADSIKTTHTGVNRVDGDSIYRLGSISKLLTVYAILMEIGDSHWNDCITQYVPELKQAPANASDALNAVQWEEVTLGELASHMAGVTRDATLEDLAANGLSLGPKLPASEVPTCGATAEQQPCSRAQFFDYLLQHHPSFPTSATPAYSNTAFVLLAYAYEALSGSTMEAAMTKLFQRTGMHSASFNESDPATGVIPKGNESSSWWNVATGNEAAAGGYFASNNDLIQLGQSMLQNTVLAPAVMRRWMKPAALTSDLNFAVGRPWEIRRIRDSNNKVTDYYTKEGELGAYSSMLILSPDYQVGMAVNVAADGGPAPATDYVHVVADALVGEFMPAVQKRAHAQAAAHYAGTYADPATNSSVTIAADARPGLALANLRLAGQDVLAQLAQRQGQSAAPSARLYPTGLTASRPRANATGPAYVAQAGWKAVYQFLPQNPAEVGAFGTNCETWAMVDSMNYGLVGLDEVLFGLAEDGAAQTVTVRALGVVMTKK